MAKRLKTPVPRMWTRQERLAWSATGKHDLVYAAPEKQKEMQRRKRKKRGD